jgi:hypothetical protein
MESPLIASHCNTPLPLHADGQHIYSNKIEKSGNEQTDAQAMKPLVHLFAYL